MIKSLYSRWINDWEKHLCFRSTDRVVRPFEWGLDWAERWPATLGLVVGATYPTELAEVRHRCPNAPILLPGIGAQAGDLEASLHAGLDSRGLGLIVSSSRSVIYAGNGDGVDWTAAVRAAAIDLRESINGVRAAQV